MNFVVIWGRVLRVELVCSSRLQSWIFNFFLIRDREGNQFFTLNCIVESHVSNMSNWSFFASLSMWNDFCVDLACHILFVWVWNIGIGIGCAKVTEYGALHSINVLRQCSYCFFLHWMQSNWLQRDQSPCIFFCRCCIRLHYKADRFNRIHIFLAIKLACDLVAHDCILMVIWIRAPWYYNLHDL